MRCSPDCRKLDKKSVTYFRFKYFDDSNEYLLTNECGAYSFLAPEDFASFIEGRLEKTSPQRYAELQSKNFIRHKLNFDELSKDYVSRSLSLGRDTSLHIVVLTLRCHHHCLYCQAGSNASVCSKTDMTSATAKSVVDRIFETAGQSILIEFQGGEPLLNLETMRFIVDYAKEKNAKEKKDLVFSVVTNLAPMNDEILCYLFREDIHICTSLDGPVYIHNKQRGLAESKDSYQNVIYWLKRIILEAKKTPSIFKPNALSTITRFSLAYPEAIIDEYVQLGLGSIHLRPVNSFGVDAKTWRKISFSLEEFSVFYKKAMDHIIQINQKGILFRERFAMIFLIKILTHDDPAYVDLQSPCGAGIGQLAYNYNGNVYTCDEGRMLGFQGDEAFKLGHVDCETHQSLRSKELLKSLCSASCLDFLPECKECVYKPYCGVCPIHNYWVNNNIFIKSPFLCQIYKMILDDLFLRMKDERVKKIFISWVGKTKPSS